MRWTKVWWPCCSSCSSPHERLNTNSWWRTQWMLWNRICCITNGKGLVLLECSLEHENKSFGYDAHWPLNTCHVLYACHTAVWLAFKIKKRGHVFRNLDKWMHFLKTTQEIFLVNVSPNPWPTVPIQVQNMKNCKAGDPHTFCHPHSSA